MKIRKDRDSSILKRFVELFLLSTAEVLLGNCQCGGPFGFHHHENGPEIKPHTIPFHVSLITDKKKPIPFCSASLISPNYVLTTARCIIGRSISSFFLAVGEHDYNVKGDGEQFVHIQAILQYPHFHDSKSCHHDFALLKLSESVYFSKHLYTGIACLPLNTTTNFAGQDLTISGWGLKSSGSEHASKLKAIVLNGISNGVCQSILPHKEISHHHICSVGSSRHLCEGNEGGMRQKSRLNRSKVV